MLTSFIPDLPGRSDCSRWQQVVKGRHSHEYVTWSGAVLCTAELSQLRRCNADKNVPLNMVLSSALPYIKMFFQDTIHYKKSWVHFSVTARNKKIWVARFKGEESVCPAFWPWFLFIVWILHHIFLVFSFNYLLRKNNRDGEGFSVLVCATAHGCCWGNIANSSY